MIASKLELAAKRAVGLLVLVPIAACGTSRLPAPLASQEMAMARAAYIGGTVAVEPDEYPVYSQRLERQLAESGLFERVGCIDTVARPTLIARVERHVSGAAVIPLWTALSLGVIPTIFTEEHGYLFSLRRATDAGSRVVVDATYSGRSMMGWFALFANISPDYAFERVETTDRYRWYFRWATAAKARELLGQEAASPVGGSP